LLDVARRGATQHPALRQILTAQIINRTLGGVVVRPWEVDELPDEWIDTIMALATELPGYRKGLATVEDVLSKWRQSHPTYRK